MWLKFNLDKVYCIHKVVRFNKRELRFTWTCTSSDCSACEAKKSSAQNRCNSLILTVSHEEQVDTLPDFTDCKYGNTVMLENTDSTDPDLHILEMAIINQGKIKFYNLLDIGTYQWPRTLL